MLRFIYGIKIELLDETKADMSNSELLDLINLYAIADKYAVSTLTEASFLQFKRIASTAWIRLWAAGTLDTLINEIYSACPSPHASIRVIAVDWTCEHIDKFKEEDTLARFRTLLGDIPDFGADIALRLADKRPLLKLEASNTSTEVRPHKTVLHWAAQASDVEACRQLLAQGIDVDVRDENDETPLHFAAWFGGLGVATLLVETGANVNATSREYNATPLHWATTRHHQEISQYLRQHGAE
jgi:Ankyrin repeats (3 copies)